MIDYWGTTSRNIKATRYTADYRNHIKNLEIETREFFEQEALIPENIQQKLPMNIDITLANRSEERV